MTFQASHRNMQPLTGSTPVAVLGLIHFADVRSGTWRQAQDPGLAARGSRRMV